MVAQGYLYQNPADRFPLRAAAGALLVGLFLTVWTWIDKRNPGRYDTFFEFAPYSTKEFTEFTAVRWTAVAGKLATDPQGKPTETTVKFKRHPGAKGPAFLEEGTGHPFTLNDSTMMTAAVVLKTDDAPEPVRFNAELKPGTTPVYTNEP